MGRGTSADIIPGAKSESTVGWSAVEIGRAAPFVAQRAITWMTVRDVLLYITLVLNVVSMIALIAGILMHSGRGGGLSDMFGGGGGAALGSTAAERNLNRITFVLALVWIFTLVAVSFFLDAI